MNKVDPIIVSFNGGEISSKLDARADLQKYLSSCRVMENFIPLVEGGAQARPGTYFVTATKDSTKTSRLFPFQFSTIQAYIIEAGEYYFRFYKPTGQIVLAYAAWVTGTVYTLGALVTNGGAWYRCIIAHTAGTFATDLTAVKWAVTGGATDLAYEIPSPYVATDLPNIKMTQSADILYLSHRSHNIKKLSRTGDAAWTLTNFIAAVGGPLVITGATAANTCVITATGEDADFPEDDDIIYISGVLGMTQLNDLFFTVALSELMPNQVDRDFDAVAAAGDGNDTYTGLLLHGDGADASTTFTDSATAGAAKAVTAIGNTQIDTSWAAFGSGSILFDGTGDGLTTADHADFTPAAAFTLDLVGKFAVLPAANEAMILYSQWADDLNHAVFSLKNSGGVYSFTLHLVTAGVKADPLLALAWTTPVINTKYHIVLTRGWGAAANSWTVCINGTSLGAQTLATTYPNIAAVFQIGMGHAGVNSIYPPAFNATYTTATSAFDATYLAYFATTPTASLTGASANVAWLSNSVNTNQRFQTDLGTDAVVTRIYYENYHASGGQSTNGVKTFTFWGSNTAGAFADVTWISDAAMIAAGWIQLTCSHPHFEQHTASDVADPQYLTVTNTVAYRYYAFKFADSWGGAGAMGFRRIELNPLTNITFNDWMDEIRWSNTNAVGGIARWTANFTPPARAYSIIIPAWANVDLNAYDETGDLTLTASVIGQYCTCPVLSAPTTIGKRYRLRFDAANIVSTWTVKSFDGTQTLGTVTARGAQSFDFLAATTGGLRMVAVTATSNGDFDNFSLVELGPFQLSGVNSSAYDAYTSGGVAQKTQFGDSGNNPGAIAFFEQRFMAGGTTNNPLDIFGSASADFENFTQDPADDSAALQYSLLSDKVDATNWMLGEDYLMIGTQGGVWRLGAATTGEPLTATSVVAKRQLSNGVKDMDAEMVADSVLYVQRGGTTVRRATWVWERDKYLAQDVTRIAKHIAKGLTRTLSGITDMDYQSEPMSILWSVRADGQLLGMVYEAEENIYGWFRVVTDGEIESVAVVTSADNEDQLWVIVNRTGGRYIEYFKPHEFFNVYEDAFFVDSGLTWSGGAAKTITGITNANPAVVTAVGHGFSNGWKVQIANVAGMTKANQVSTDAYTVANKTDNTFQLSGINSSVSAAWITSYAYGVGNKVTQGGSFYQCLIAHTSGVFATDLAALKWEVTTGWAVYTSGGTARRVDNSLGGFSHLALETVAVLTNHGKHPAVVVSAGGVITLTWYASVITAGLPYDYKLQPMKIEPGSPEGTSRGRKKRIYALSVAFYEAAGMKWGPDATHLEDVPFDVDSVPELFTGDKETDFDADYETGASIYLLGQSPLPCTVLSVMPKMVVVDG